MAEKQGSQVSPVHASSLELSSWPPPLSSVDGGNKTYLLKPDRTSMCSDVQES